MNLQQGMKVHGARHPANKQHHIKVKWCEHLISI